MVDVVVEGAGVRLRARVYDRLASPDRIGPAQDPVWAKNVVARRIAIDDAGFVSPKPPPDLDPETLSRRSRRAGELVGRGDEARRFVADRSGWLRARARGRGRQSRAPRHATRSNRAARTQVDKVAAAAARKPPCTIR